MNRQILTNREQEVYSYILEYRQKKRFSPSMREIAAALSFSSVSTVHRFIHVLIDKGWILPINGGKRQLVTMDELGYERDVI